MILIKLSYPKAGFIRLNKFSSHTHTTVKISLHVLAVFTLKNSLFGRQKKSVEHLGAFSLVFHFIF